MILVFGKTGQLARALENAPGVTLVGRDVADLSDPKACGAVIKGLRPCAVINAAAFTSVDLAEQDEPLAHIINAQAPSVMAQSCAAMGIPFVHVSTDYVFDGSGTAPRLPDAPTAPLNAYGRTKLAGEQGVRDVGGTHVVLRTSWVVSGSGTNFVTTMMRLGANRDSLNVVADQIGGPTPAPALAEAVLATTRGLLQDPTCSGTYHFSGSPNTSWADFARAIMKEAALPCTIEDITTAQYGSPTARPLNSRLDCNSFKTVFGVRQPDWRAALPGLVVVP